MFGKSVLAIGCLGVLVSAGCANKEVVKKDNPIAAETVNKAAFIAPAASAAVSNQNKEEHRNTGIESKTPTSSPSVVRQTVQAEAVQPSLENVYFNFDSSALSTTARDTLTRSAEVLMKSLKDNSIRIEGNCDERGSAEYNLALGERRAKVAEKYLTTLGVPSGRISVVSYGKEKPAVQGSDEAAWAKNRRDEFVIQK
ncbi:MAG: peptidoglycan-associated lipoprotein Pal [Desulfuromonadaceae bacterium]|nr:peptidoglycan-associated lipoprotein Pal [Desulfuromonadaceae bacterium]